MILRREQQLITDVVYGDSMDEGIVESIKDQMRKSCLIERHGACTDNLQTQLVEVDQQGERLVYQHVITVDHDILE